MLLLDFGCGDLGIWGGGVVRIEEQSGLLVRDLLHRIRERRGWDFSTSDADMPPSKGDVDCGGGIVLGAAVDVMSQS